MTAVITALDGAGTPKMVIYNAAYALALVTITLAATSFSMSAGVLTLLGVPISGVVANTGTAALAQFQDGASTWWIEGLTVGTTGTDIIVNSTSLTAGQTLTVTAGLITAAP